MTPLAPTLHVRRWHANAAMCHVHDTLAAHCGRMVAHAMHLFPDTWLELVPDIMKHDAVESVLGDPPWGSMDDDPALKAAWDAAALRIERANGWEWVRSPQLKLLDRLDAYMMVKRHAPDELAKTEWRKSYQAMQAEARRLGCFRQWIEAMGS